jgi:hypothetical protein
MATDGGPVTTFLVSYAAGPRVHALNQDALVDSAAGKGIDVVLAYRLEHLSEEFRVQHRHILEQPRGAGYWLWKPYIIRDGMDRAEEGDVVVYLDAGVLIHRHLEPLLEQARRRELMLVKNRHPNRPYVKRDCFVLTGTDLPECHEAPQLDASCLLIKNTRANRELIATWLDLCTDARILTDAPNECRQPNLPGFVSHRHDQAVLSLLYWKRRDQLMHQLCERQLLRRYLEHHRRRTERVPIGVWSRLPRRVRNWILYRGRATRKRLRSHPEEGPDKVHSMRTSNCGTGSHRTGEGCQAHETNFDRKQR